MRVALCLATLLALRTQSAEACSPPRFVVPIEGATNVPTNIVEVISGNPFTVPGPYLRKSGTDTPIVVEETKEWGLRRLRFTAELEANTTYELVSGGDVYSSFTTGAGRDDVAPMAITLDDLQIAHAIHDPETSCGAREIAVSGTIHGLGEEPLLRVRVTGEGQVQERMIPPQLWLLGYPLSDLELDVNPGMTYDIEVWARDLAGNEGPIARYEGAIVRDCGVIPLVNWGSLHDCPLDAEPLPEVEESGCSTGGGAGLLVGILAIFLQPWRRRACRSVTLRW